MSNFRERQRARWASVPQDDRAQDSRDSGVPFTTIHPTHKDTIADHGTAGGGNGMRDRIDERDPRGAQLGAHWAGAHPTAPFNKTVGLMPDVNGHVQIFAKSVNMSGGVNQPGYYTSDCAPGTVRASIHQFKRKYEIQGQGSGETFKDRQAKRRSGHGG